MAIIKRILNMCRADLHGLVDMMENRELLMKKYLRDMQDNLHVHRASLEEIHQQLKSSKAEYSSIKEELAKIEVVLEKALQAGKDDLARLLIRKKRSHSSILETLTSQIKEIESKKRELTILLQTRNEQYQEMLLKAKWGVPSCVSQKGKTEDTDWIHAEEDIETELSQRKLAIQTGEEKP